MGKKILIVGGVAGGASCATRARRLDENADITIFEQGPYVSFANCGLPYHIGKVIPDSENLIVASPEMFKEWFNIKVKINTKVQSINSKKREITIKNLLTNENYSETYDSLLLSTGAVPKLPKIEGINLPGIFTLRNIPDAFSISGWLEKIDAKKAIILGGGFIGLELAENLVKLGINVHIVEILSHILPNLDKEMALLVQEHINKMGIELHLEHKIEKFKIKNKSNSLIAYLAPEKKIDTDIVIIASGIKPENQLAISAGLSIGKYGGIKVNKHMQTSNPNIWAVGDVVEVNDFIFNEPIQAALAGPANRQGRIAAESIVKTERSSIKSFRGVQNTSVCGILGITIASVGLSENKIQQLNIKNSSVNYEKIHIHAYNHAEYYPGAKKMTIKLLFLKDTGHIIGAQAVGFNGVAKRIDIISMAIQNKATVFDLSEAELCYAPQYGSAKDPINIAGMVASNVINKYFDITHLENIESTTGIILDVREDFVYKRNHIEKAINIPLENLRERINELNKDKKILVYCLEGKRSYFACRILKQKGFNTKSLSGGYTMYKVYKKYLKKK